MAKQFIEILKNTLHNSTSADSNNVEILRNIAKEEIQYYVLDFIYHHHKYSNWTMYGGSALRICYNLNRMSIDLDFEIKNKCTQGFLNTLKKEVENYFTNKHGLEHDLLTIKIVNSRGLLLRFIIGTELGITHHSKQVHVKIDLNHFVPSKPIEEKIPINHGQLSFVINTYNISTLMASKIAAILLRGVRRVGKATYEEKGRDIYDLLWYMEKKIIPNLSYLRDRTGNTDMTNLRVLFNKLTLQMDKVNNKNLRHDLYPLFLDQEYIDHWLAQWHESYLQLIKSYTISTISRLREISIRQGANANNYLFEYIYDTVDDSTAKIIYVVNDTFFKNSNIKILTTIDENLTPLIHSTLKKMLLSKAIYYVKIFHEKNINYLTNTNNIIPSIIKTKIICLSKGNESNMIILDRKTLLTCELEHLL